MAERIQNHQFKISVVIVSRDRPSDLARCLTACAQIDYPAYEIVVVADEIGLKSVAAHPVAKATKSCRFDEANISKARNLGISLTGGDIVAFIDDDAVPEPSWLSALSEAFDREDVSGVGGAVLGRNGISFQSNSPSITRDGHTHDGPAPSPGAVPKLVGTNMAIRRDVLVDIGGFDPRYSFFLEDADLSLRLADGGHKVAHCQSAVVHHAFAPSARRRADRFPKRLDEIGHSTAVFLSAHSIGSRRAEALLEFRNAERQRLLRHMVRGSCEPRDVERILAGFDRGVESAHDTTPHATGDCTGSTPFRGFEAPNGRRPTALLAARYRHRRRLRAEAEKAAAGGATVSAFLFSATSLYHKVRFDDAGFWLQTGGQFGRSVRSEPIFAPWSFRGRVERECARTLAVRCPGEVTQPPQIRWISQF